MQELVDAGPRSIETYRGVVPDWILDWIGAPAVHRAGGRPYVTKDERDDTRPRRRAS